MAEGIAPHFPPPRLEPLSADTIRIAYTSSKVSFLKLKRAEALLRHKFPFGGFDLIIDLALDDLLDKRDPDRRIARKKERGKGPAPMGCAAAGRRIPQAVKDEVWERDGGRCAFVGKDSRRCEGRAFLEYDHVIPYALGGRSDTARNIRLLCRAHNQEAGRAAFGPQAGRSAADAAQKQEQAEGREGAVPEGDDRGMLVDSLGERQDSVGAPGPGSSQVLGAAGMEGG